MNETDLPNVHFASEKMEYLFKELCLELQRNIGKYPKNARMKLFSYLQLFESEAELN